ncbi:MAG: GntR family transcriptional regulator [Paracoccaceae bacterium]
MAERLRGMIVNGELEEGKKIPVAAVSEKLGVSLTPLREALKVLAEEQLVELTPNRGARVLPVTVADMKALFEVTAELEALAARLATERMSDEELQVLENMHSKMRGFFESRDRAAYFDLNNKIHVAIAEFSHNPVLSHMHKKINVRVARVRFIAFHDAERWEQAMSEHEDLMVSFRERDMEKAAAIWRVHLQRSGAVTTKLLSEHVQQ